ncbi:hypothetical protein ASC61_01915 [Aeromicrobium sp. Root344]|nr:hypothetical protein ASC61_01915 [Aeromicrobium sp. Root344]
MTAATEVRATAKWLATAIAAIASVVFGAGPLISNATDATDWGGLRWTIVLVSAAVGILGATAIVSSLVMSMMPVEVTLDSLPDELVARVNEDPDAYLPGDATNIADFRARLVSYAKGTAELEARARRATPKAEETRYEALAKIQSEKFELYQRGRAELFNQAKFMIESNRLTGRDAAKKFALPAVAVVVATTVFTFVTHTPAKEDSPSTAPKPQGALLVPADGSQSLWNELQLSRCQLDKNEEGVPVLLLGTSGEDTLNYNVQTLGTPAGCGRYSFTVSDEIVDVVVPTPLKVKGAE